MANLYYTNASGDERWDTLSNWNTASDGSGDSPNSIPWVNGYYDYDLIDASGDAPNILRSIISASVTGTCSVKFTTSNDAVINGGTFTAQYIVNNGTINAGTFTGSFFTNIGYNTSLFGVINGGTFSGSSFTNSGAIINGGIFSEIYFSNSVTVSGMIISTINGGTFEINGFDQSGIIAANVTLKYNGVLYAGTFNGYEYVNGEISKRLYYTNSTGDFLWETLANWNTLPDDTGYSPSGIPWVNGYFDYHLFDANPETVPEIYKVQITGNTIPNTVTASFNINYAVFFGTNINGGNFNANNTVFSESIVNNGIFTGNDINSNSIINGGTFNGLRFNNSGTVNGGTFNTQYFTNNSTINGGDFNGQNFTNNGNINNGSFEIKDFTQNGTVVPYITVSYEGNAYVGSFNGSSYINGQVSAMNLYFTNAVGDSLWNTLGNWNTASDGSGSNPTSIPWVDGYFDYDLIDATDSLGVSITQLVISGSVTGTCSINNVSFFSCTINSGTWSGNSCSAIFLTYFNGGTFAGNNWYVNGFVSGGNWTGSGLVLDSNNDYYIISGGTFSGASITINAGDAFSSVRVTGGVFSSESITINGANLGAGEFNIDGIVLNDSPIIAYQDITVTSGGSPYTGSWQGQIWSAGVWISAELSPTILYYTNAGGDGLWSTLQNWNTSADGLGESVNSIPWTTSATSNANLYLSSPELAAPVLNGLMLGGNGQDFSIAATCDQKIAQEIIGNGYDIVAQAVV